MLNTKSYIDKKSIKEVQEKGFSVYNYISIKELLSTINKDYLSTLSAINIPFAILSVIIGFISYETYSYTLLITFFLAVYACIFIYLIAKLIYRTYKYSLVTNVIYSHKGLVIGKSIFNYQDDSKLLDLLKKYEDIFSEYLSKPSTLKDEIRRKKEKLKNGLQNNFSFINKLSSGRSSRNSDSGKFAIIALAILVIYSITITIFYFLGIALGFILFFIIIYFIELYFKFNKSIELKIKNITTYIGKDLNKLEAIYQNLNTKISTFEDGEINDLSRNIDKEYSEFYSIINKTIDKKDTLKKLIEESIYKDFIDFSLFALYLKKQFNKPLNEMIDLLEQYKRNILKQINEIEETIKSIPIEDKHHIETKLTRMYSLNKNLNLQLETLKASTL